MTCSQRWLLRRRAGYPSPTTAAVNEVRAQLAASVRGRWLTRGEYDETGDGRRVYYPPRPHVHFADGLTRRERNVVRRSSRRLERREHARAAA